jgi:hypothetical protein
LPAPPRHPPTARAGLAALLLVAAAGGASAAPTSLPGHPGLPLLPATEPAFRGEARAVIAWPCLDRPGCDEAPAAPAAALGEAAAASSTAADARVAAIPLPAALTLLGLSLSALGVMMHRARSRG